LRKGPKEIKYSMDATASPNAISLYGTSPTAKPVLNAVLF